MLVAFVLISVFDRCAAVEMRTVGNAQVDLQPLVDWSVKKKGERPLKHWKLVQVLELKKPSASPALQGNCFSSKAISRFEIAKRARSTGAANGG
jgi:hypothetical protein